MSRRPSPRCCAYRIAACEPLEPRVVLTGGLVPGAADPSGPDRGVVVINPTELGEPGMGMNLDKPTDIPISTPVNNGFSGVPNPTGGPVPQGNPDDPPPLSTDLAVQFVGVPASTPAGSVLTYTLELANNGTETAENVVVTIAIPRLAAFVSSSVTAGTFAATTGRWIVGSFGPGLAVLTLRVSVDAVAAGHTIRALPLVTSTTPDPDPFNNVVMFNTHVTDAAANSPPTISSLAVTPASVIEGGTVQLTGTFSDPDAADALLLRVDWDGDGAFDEDFPVAGGAFAFGNHFPDDPQGPDAYEIHVELDDGKGGVATESVPLTLANDVPSVAAGEDAEIPAGEAFSRKIIFADAGDDAPWTVTIDWGDGSPLETVMTDARSLLVSHVFASAGTSTVTVSVDDGDGGVGSASFAVTRPAKAAAVAAPLGETAAGAGEAESVGNGEKENEGKGTTGGPAGRVAPRNFLFLTANSQLKTHPAAAGLPTEPHASTKGLHSHFDIGSKASPRHTARSLAFASFAAANVAPIALASDWLDAIAAR